MTGAFTSHIRKVLTLLEVKVGKGMEMEKISINLVFLEHETVCTEDHWYLILRQPGLHINMNCFLIMYEHVVQYIL
jgi:hypothetical protein